jgi:4-hydroxy-tetrahydrodipicolinate synthase
MIKGSIVAIVTPMHEDGSLDLAAFRALIDFHIAEGTDAIVVVGTTGESPTVNVEEHGLLITEAVKHAAKRIPIIAGTGANSTREAIELAAFAKKAGADASLSIKDATGGIERGSDLLQRAPKDFAIYSGDDASTLALMLLGAHGTISVTANVAPKLMHEMCAAALNGEVAKAREINFRLLGLHRNLFVEANPIPVKWAVARMGKMKNNLRLPLTPLSAGAQPAVEAAMRQAGVI